MYENLSNDRKKILEVHRPASGQAIGIAKVSFWVVKPLTSRESKYTIYVSMGDDVRSKQTEGLTISAYTFSAR